MHTEQIQAVRSFNRAVTQRIGVLNTSYLDRGRPLGEARLLYEIGRDGGDVRKLRETLGLDSGYLSRLLRSLERQGLVRTRRGAEDRRSRYVEPTPTGLQELAEYGRRSDDFAASLLRPLSEKQRENLIAAMAEVERLLRAAVVEIRLEAPDGAVVLGCLEAYYRELAQRFESGYDPTRTTPAPPDELRPPTGCFLVAYLDGTATGCGALRVRDGGIGEIRRMWVAAGARGLGIGRRLLAALEERAHQFGLGVVRLDTNKALTEAQNLYRTSGYSEVARFNDELYAHHWFEKRLPTLEG